MNLNKILEFHFSGANAVMAVHETLTAGMVGKKIMFKFTPEWDSLNKTIVYMAGDIVRAVPYKDENVIHPDVLAKPGVRLFVGAFGESADDELVIPTIFARGPEVHLGTDPLDAPVDPEPISMYCRLLAQIGDLGDLKTEAKESLVAAINEVARDVSIPTKLSAFENDVGYLTATDLDEYDGPRDAIPSGGKKGQYLRKKSDDDGDVEWADFEIPEEYGLISYNQDKVITIT